MNAEIVSVGTELLLGNITDTNATVVGYTILRAFLQHAGHSLEEQQIQKLEEFVMSSWTKPYKELIPDFFTLTFTAYQPD